MIPAAITKTQQWNQKSIHISDLDISFGSTVLCFEQRVTGHNKNLDHVSSFAHQSPPSS